MIKQTLGISKETKWMSLRFKRKILMKMNKTFLNR